MIFLEVLVALTIERLWLSVAAWRRFTWFIRFAAWSETQVTGGNDGDIHGDTRVAGGEVPGAASRTNKSSDRRSRTSVLLATLAPALGVGLMHYLLSESLLILAVIFDVAVLIYCLGPKDLDTQVRAFMHVCARADKDAARQSMADIIDVDVASLGSLTMPQMMQSVIETMLIQANERWFAIIFWFVVLGPMGAVFFRLSSLLKYNVDAVQLATSEQRDNFAAAAHHLHVILGWLPARFTALSYAIMGSFVDAIDGWTQDMPDHIINRSPNNEDVIVASGLGALRMYDAVHGVEKKTIGIHHVRNALALVWRTVIFCLGVILIITFMDALI